MIESRFRDLRTITVGLIVGLTAAYLGADAVMRNEDLNIAIDVVLCVVAAMALCYYAGRAIEAVWTGSRAHIDYLIVAIALGWWSQSGQAFLRVVARLSHFDPAFINNELFGLLKLGSVIAAILHVVPRGAADGNVPRTNSAVVASCLAGALALAVVVVTVRPNPRPLIEMMPMWSRDVFRTGDAPRLPARIG